MGYSRNPVPVGFGTTLTQPLRLAGSKMIHGVHGSLRQTPGAGGNGRPWYLNSAAFPTRNVRLMLRYGSVNAGQKSVWASCNFGVCALRMLASCRNLQAMWKTCAT